MEELSAQRSKNVWIKHLKVGTRKINHSAFVIKLTKKKISFIFNDLYFAIAHKKHIVAIGSQNIGWWVHFLTTVSYSARTKSKVSFPMNFYI